MTGERFIKKMLRGKLEENRENRAGEGYDMENLSKIPSQVNF